MKIKAILFLGLRLILGIIFVYASLDKIVHPAAFAEVIYNYHILPPILTNITAIFLPWLELTIGVLLIIGRLLPGAVSIANILLIVFYTALLFNLVRGLNINCGCFSTQAAGEVSNWLLVLRDTFFLIIGIPLFIMTFRHSGNNKDLEVK